MNQQPSPVFSQAGMAFSPHALSGLHGQQSLALSQQGAPLILPPTVGSAAVNPYTALMQQGALLLLASLIKTC